MADIDALRQALRDNRGSPGQAIDIDVIMTRGRRLRRRRRLTVAAAAACLVAAATVGITHQTGSAPAPAQHPVSTVTHHPSPAPHPSTSPPGLPGSPTPSAN